MLKISAHDIPVEGELSPLGVISIMAKRCTNCGWTTGDSNVTCPMCDASLPVETQQPSAGEQMAGGLLFIACGLGIAWGLGWIQPAKWLDSLNAKQPQVIQKVSARQSSPANDSTPIPIALSTLFNEYVDNQYDADQKYMDRRVRFTDQQAIYRIEKDYSEGYYATFEVYRLYVQAYFRDSSQLSNLTGFIQIECTCKGKPFHYVKLIDCHLLSKGK